MTHRASEPHAALGHLARLAGRGRPVLVLHSWWGLTPAFTTYADRLAERGFLVGCADLYDGAVASTPEEVATLRSARRAEPVYRTMLRALAELRADDASDGSPPALVGFSMGGFWAMWLAQRTDVAPAGVVLYYAARAIRGGAPVPVLAHFADVDEFVSATGRRGMERSLAAHGWPYTAHDHPGTTHWFAESDQDAFDPDAALAALEHTVEFLRLLP